MTKRQTITTGIFMCLTMIMLASIDGIVGVFLPIMKNNFNVTDTQMAIVFTTDSCGFILCTFLGGKFCGKIGHKKTFLLGFIIIVSAGILMQFASNLYLLMLFSFLFNCGLSITTISANASTPIMFTASSVAFLSTFHLFYSLGGAVSKKIAGILLDINIDWRYMYLGISIFALLLILYLFFANIPTVSGKLEKHSEKLVDLIKNKTVVLYIFIVGTHIAAVGSTASWFVNYAVSSFGIDVNNASTYIAGFAFLNAIGMLIFMPFIKKIGKKNIVIVFPLFACIIYFIGVILGINGLSMIAFSGIFLSVVYPTTIIIITDKFKKNASFILGIIVTFGSIINMLFNLLIGKLSDLIGIRNAFYLVPILMLAFSALSFISFHKSEEQ